MRAAARATALALLLNWAASAFAEADVRPWKGGAKTALKLRDLQERPVDLAALKGRVVLINFWATWCEPCRSEMPDLQKAVDAYNGSVVVVGVNKLEPVAVIPPFVNEMNVGFPLVVNTKGDISTRYAAKNIPTSFFINTDGTIGFRQIGVMNYAFIKQHLDQLK